MFKIKNSIYDVSCLTVDDNSRRGAASLGHDVAGDAGIVSRIGEASFGDDEIMVTSRIDGAFRAERLFIFQPFHLKTTESMSNTNTAVCPPNLLCLIPSNGLKCAYICTTRALMNGLESGCYLTLLIIQVDISGRCYTFS